MIERGGAGPDRVGAGPAGVVADLPEDIEINGDPQPIYPTHCFLIFFFGFL